MTGTAMIFTMGLKFRNLIKIKNAEKTTNANFYSIFFVNFGALEVI